MPLQWNVDQFRPPLGVAPTTLIVAAALVAALVFYLGSAPRRPWVERLALLSLRLAATALLAWMLAGPSMRTLAPLANDSVRLILLADRSASMAACDVPAPPNVFAKDPQADPPDISRWDALRLDWLHPDRLQNLREQFNLELLSFAEHVDTVAAGQIDRVTPDGASTNLFDALAKAANDRSANLEHAAAGMIVLLSDGHDTQQQNSPALLARLRQLGWPVYAVPVGTDLPVKDLAVLAWADSDFLFSGQSTAIHATLTHDGLAGQRAMVSLLREGEALERREVTLEAGRPVQLDFRVTPSPSGDAPLTVEGYQIVVEPIEGERYIDNNQRWIFLQVSRQRIRVALFDGSPYWDTRFLVQALRGDPQIDLTSVFALSPKRIVTVRYAGSSGPAAADLQLPVTAAQLNSFDVVILGKQIERFFGGERAALLRDFVIQRGGALVLARGQPFDVTTAEGRQGDDLLAGVAPVAWGRDAVAALRLQLTPAGEHSPLLNFQHASSTEAILTELPGMIAATQVQQEKAASIVLLRQGAGEQEAGMAALVHQNVGAGRVLAVLNEGLWQWAFLPSRMREYDSIFQQFWGQAIRWLATGGSFLPGQAISMSLNRLMVEPGQEATVTVSMRSPPRSDGWPTLRIIDPRGQRQDVPLTSPTEQSLRRVAVVRPQEAGVHVLELLSPGFKPARLTARLAVYDASVEKLDASARPQTLQALCAATGGELLDFDHPDRMTEIAHRLRLTRASDERMEYVFNMPAVLGSMLVLLGLEWNLRRRQGLL